jgi:hypothetical protein
MIMGSLASTHDHAGAVLTHRDTPGTTVQDPRRTQTPASQVKQQAKTQQKISGRLRSEQVTHDRYAVRGYISTVAKHGAHVLTAIHDALAGDPWMPPIPDPP